MAKEVDIDISQFDDFKSEDFNVDFDDVTKDSDSDRDPINQTRQRVSNGLKSSLAGVGSSVESRVRQEFPATSDIVGQATSFIGGTKYLAGKFQQDIQPAINTIKRTGRQLSPKIKQFLPKKFHKSIDRLFEAQQSDGYRPLSKEQERERSIGLSVGSIFQDQQSGAQSSEERIEDKETQIKDQIIDRALDDHRHKESFDQLDKIRLATEFSSNYTKTIYTAFLKKDLELKYKHFFVAQDTLATSMGIAKLLEVKLDQIRHNTALPDIQKLHKVEAIKEVLSKRFGESITNLGQSALKKVSAKIFQPLTTGVQQLGELADGIGMMDSMSADAASMGMPQKSMMDMALEFGAGKIGELGGGAVGNYLFGKKYAQNGVLSGQQNTIEAVSRNLMTHFGLMMQEKKEATEYESPMLSSMYDIFSPDVSRGTGSIANVNVNNPLSPAVHNVAEQTSIVEIIPGLLAKIEQNTRSALSGKEEQELVYDYKTRDFVTSEEYKKDVINSVFGNKTTRESSIGDAVGNIRGAYMHMHGDTNLDSFDQLLPEIAKFIVNSGIAKRPLKLQTLSAYIDGTVENENDTQYIDQVMKGIEHKTEVAQFLVAALTFDDGRINRDAKARIDAQIIDYMQKDEYLASLPKYLQGYGTGRHLKGVLDIKQYGAKVNDAFVRDAYGNLGSDNASIVNASEQTNQYLNDQVDKINNNQDSVSSFITNAVLRGLKSNYGKSPTVFDSAAVYGTLPHQMASTATNVVNDIYTDVSSQQIQPPTKSVDSIRIAKPAATPNQQPADQQQPDKTEQPSQPQEKQPYAPLRMAPQDQSSIEEKSFLSTLKELFLGKKNKALNVDQQSDEEQLKEKLDAQELRLQKIQAQQVEQLTKTPVNVDASGDKTKAPLQPAQASQSSIGGTGEIVNAITHFEDTFSAYASNQQKSIDILERIAATSAEMNDKLLNVLASVSPTVIKLWHRGKALTASAIGTLFRGGLSLAKMPLTVGGATAKLLWNATKSVAPVAASAAKSIGGAAFNATKWAAKTAIQSPLALMRGALDVIGGTSTLFNSAVNAVKDKLTNRKFCDVYLKGEVAPDKILITKIKQVSGVVYSDGSPVKSSYKITAPVFDPETKDCLITKEQIETGLVDIDGNSLASRSLGGNVLDAVKKIGGLFGSGIGNALKFTKDLMASNPLFKLMGLGVDIGKGLFQGGKFLVKRLFGADQDKSNAVTTDDIKTYISDKLDSIYELLVAQFNKQEDVYKGRRKSASDKSTGLDENGNKIKPTATREHERAVLKSKQEKEAAAKEGSSNKLLSVLNRIKKNTKDTSDNVRKGFKDTIKNLGKGLLGKLGTIFDAVKGIGSFFGDMIESFGIKKLAKSVLGKAGTAIANVFAKKGVAKAAETTAKAGGKAAINTIGKVATGAAAKTAAKTAGKIALKTGAKMLAGAAGLIVTGPVGWAIGAYMLADTAYDVYKAFTINSDDLVPLRAELYGIDLKKSSGILFRDSYEELMLKLEEETYGIMIGERKPFDDDDLEDWADTFGLDDDDTDQVKYFATWYRQRFVPVFGAYVTILKNGGILLKDADSLEDDVKEAITKKLREVVEPKVASLKALSPSLDAYKLFAKTAKDVNVNNVSEKDREKAAASRNNNKTYTAKASNKYATTTKDIATANKASADLNKTANVASAYATATALSGAADAGKKAGSAYVPGQQGSPAMPTPANVNTGPDGNVGATPVDTTNVDTNESLGALSSKYESDGYGGIVGYDRVGGTSYGKYQFASKPGTFKRFLMWFKEQNEQVVNAFIALDPKGWESSKTFGNTGSKTGAMPDLWKKLFDAGSIPTGLQYKYLYVSHFEATMKIVSKKNQGLYDLIMSTLTLQKIVFSTAIQHGAYGGARVLMQAYKSGMTAEELISAIYDVRAGKFGSSSPEVQASARRRMNNEKNDALSAQTAERKAGIATGAPAAGAAGQSAGGSASGGGATASTSGSGSSGGASGVSIPADLSGNNGVGGTASSYMTEQTGQGSADASSLKKQSGVDVAGLHPAVIQRLVDMNKEYKQNTGSDFMITSGYRSIEKQRQLYNSMPAGKAARPGSSMHNFGLAVDINTPDANKLNQLGLLDKYKFKRTVAGEAWHIEPSDIDRNAVRTSEMKKQAQAAGQASAPDSSVKPAPQDTEGVAKTTDKTAPASSDPATNKALASGPAPSMDAPIVTSPDVVSPTAPARQQTASSSAPAGASTPAPSNYSTLDAILSELKRANGYLSTMASQSKTVYASASQSGAQPTATNTPPTQQTVQPKATAAPNKPAATAAPTNNKPATRKPQSTPPSATLNLTKNRNANAATA